MLGNKHKVDDLVIFINQRRGVWHTEVPGSAQVDVLPVLNSPAFLGRIVTLYIGDNHPLLHCSFPKHSLLPLSQGNCSWWKPNKSDCKYTASPVSLIFLPLPPPPPPLYSPSPVSPAVCHLQNCGRLHCYRHNKQC